MLLVGSVIAFVVVSRRHPGREGVLVRGAEHLEGAPAPGTTDGAATDPRDAAASGRPEGYGDDDGHGDGGGEAEESPTGKDSGEHPVDR